MLTKHQISEVWYELLERMKSSRNETNGTSPHQQGYRAGLAEAAELLEALMAETPAA
jgi:hypothetical protein